MKIPVLPIVFFFTLLLTSVILGFRFIGNDGHNEFQLETIAPYLPGQEFQTAKCDNLVIIGQHYYDNGDSYYYCNVDIYDGIIKYVSIIMDANRAINYTYFSFHKDAVEIDDILAIWPGKVYKRYKFRLYGYITYDNIHTTAKLRENGIGYAIISVTIYRYKEVLK